MEADIPRKMCVRAHTVPEVKTLRPLSRHSREWSEKNAKCQVDTFYTMARGALTRARTCKNFHRQNWPSLFPRLGSSNE